MEKEEAASVLQKLSRSFLAKREFLEKTKSRKALDEKVGIHAPFVPTPPSAIKWFRDEFVREGDVLCDLGCGDGRVLLGCADKISRGIGVDIQETPLARARVATASIAKPNLEWIQADFRDDKVCEVLQREVTVCFLFLLPEVLLALQKYLAKNMRIGTRIVCYTFSMNKPDEESFIEGFRWIPRRQINIPDLPAGACTLYEYMIDDQLKSSIR
jgi:SAM-dependent methyltransferase